VYIGVKIIAAPRSKKALSVYDIPAAAGRFTLFKQVIFCLIFPRKTVFVILPEKILNI
jgi:hypothetical protein